MKKLVDINKCRDCPYHAPNFRRCAKAMKDFEDYNKMIHKGGFPDWCPLPTEQEHLEGKVLSNIEKAWSQM